MRNGIVIGSMGLALALSACGGGDADTVEETPNGVTQVPPPGTNMNTVAAAESDDPTPTDAPNYAMKAGFADLYEIDAGRLAGEKAQSPALKKFGAQMIADHTAMSADMKRAIADAGLNLVTPVATDEKHQALLDALGQVNGPAFDALYRQQQLTAHQEALALHQSYAATGDTPQLKAIATAAVPKVEGHLNMLREMK